MTRANKATVGKYLVKRLEQAGLKHIFGVPGDYVLDFFDCLEESNIEIVGTCNELNAGYAADAYARVNGVGGVCITYGVGGFSLFNAVVGAFAERVPLIVISGGPKLSEHPHRYLLHHTIGGMQLQYEIYEKITVASVILRSPEQAPQQIDEAITACLRFKRPVYIEIPVDIVSRPCRDPGPFEVDTSIPSDKDVLEEAVDEAVGLLKLAKSPVILAGIEAHRLNTINELRELIDHTGYPFTTTMLGKSVLPEKHPQFAGVYNGIVGRESVRRIVEEADVVLGLGVLMTDINFGAWTSQLDISKMIVANSDNVRIKHHMYSQISLKDFTNGLREKLPGSKPSPARIEHPAQLLKEDLTPASGQKITVNQFYRRINQFIEANYIIIPDAGDSILNASDLFVPENVGFIGQAFYLSIGYSIPAALGVKLAAPDKRPVVLVGDGAFQMTAQELSTIIWHNQNPVIFLINNDGYTLERMIHGEGSYNELNMWHYYRLPEVFRGEWGCQVKTEDELENALQKAKNSPDSLAFIEVWLDRNDCCKNLQKMGGLSEK